jgi:hypothetical protein
MRPLAEDHNWVFRAMGELGAGHPPLSRPLDSFYDTETALTPSDQRACIHHTVGKHNPCPRIVNEMCEEISTRGDAYL